jgi:tryptophan synthase alpha chain
MIQFPKSKPVLIAYVTCGDPDLGTTQKIILSAIDAGAGIIELGVPFSDPVADGPIIQRASERALAHGTSLSDVLQLAKTVRRQRPLAGLILFSYFNPVLRFGLSKFCAAAKEAGVDGALITDLTVEEAGEYRSLMRTHGLAAIFLAAPTSTDVRLRRIAAASSGFIYAVSRTGVTGTRQTLAADAAQLVRRLRRVTALPIAVGFGISNPAQFQAAAKFADGVVVGSALVEVIEQSARSESAGSAAQAADAFIRGLKNPV